MYNENFLDARESTSLFQHMTIYAAMSGVKCPFLCHLHLSTQLQCREELGRDLILASIHLPAYVDKGFSTSMCQSL